MCAATYRGSPGSSNSTSGGASSSSSSSLVPPFGSTSGLGLGLGATGSSCHVFQLTLRRPVVDENVDLSQSPNSKQSTSVLGPSVAMFGKNTIVATKAKAPPNTRSGFNSASKVPLHTRKGTIPQPRGSLDFEARRVQCRSCFFSYLDAKTNANANPYPNATSSGGDSGGDDRIRCCVAVGDDRDNSVVVWDVRRQQVRAFIRLKKCVLYAL